MRLLFQRSLFISDIPQACDGKLSSFLGLVLLWQTNEIVQIEDQARARLHEAHFTNYRISLTYLAVRGCGRCFYKVQREEGSR